MVIFVLAALEVAVGMSVFTQRLVPSRTDCPDSLGPGQHTQYSLLPVPQFTHHVIAVALGQDHTLALTTDNEVLSWGLNRFSQLGYLVEQAPPAGALHARAVEEPIQVVARKVLGPLKRVVVIGVAACKTASVCWTGMDVFTWGTNNGQLGTSRGVLLAVIADVSTGYDRVAQPVQILPRKVTGVRSVMDLAISVRFSGSTTQ